MDEVEVENVGRGCCCGLEDVNSEGGGASGSAEDGC